MNEFLGAVVVAASVQQVNQAIKQLGFNSINDLTNAIRQLDIEIAKSKDDGRPYLEKEKLREQYIALQKEYEAAVKEAEEKEKAKKTTAIIILIVFVVISFIIMAVVLATI